MFRVLFLVSVSTLGLQIGYTAETRTTLSRNLLSRHSAYEFPAEKITATIWASVYQLIEVNWMDKSLAWDRAQFNFSSVWLPVWKVWRPDLVVYNIMRFENLMASTTDYVKIDSTGKVVNNFPMIYTASCSIRISKFPFDKQICVITLGSWTMDASVVDLVAHSDHLETSNFVPNNQWKLTEATIVRNFQEYETNPPDPPVGYVDIKFNFYLTRQPMFFVFTLVVPSCIITVVALLGIFSPAQSDGVRVEKVTMGLTTMLTMAVFLLMVSDQTPKDSTSIPLLSLYIMMDIGVVTSGTLVSIFVMKLQVSDLQDTQVTSRWKWFATHLSKHIRAKVEGPKGKVAPNHTEDKKYSKKYEPDKVFEKAFGKNANKSDLTWNDVCVVVDKFALYVHFGLFMFATVVMMIIVPLSA